MHSNDFLYVFNAFFLWLGSTVHCSVVTVCYGQKSFVYTKVCFVRTFVRCALCAGLCARLVRWARAEGPVCFVCMRVLLCA